MGGCALPGKHSYSAAQIRNAAASFARAQACIRNRGRPYCLFMAFTLTFPFIWFSLLLFLHVFADAYLVFFRYFSHSKVVSLFVFKTFLRLFMFRFIRASRRVSFEMELS
jgi:hypothetical protein